MRIHESFARETDSPMHPRGTIAGWRKAVTAATLLACATGISLAQRHDNDDAFLPSPVRTVSTVPSNGDVNPYGVAFILHDFQAGSGPLKPGDILVSNFNNRQNLQGTGTTIVRISKTSPSPTLFFQGTAPLGLSTALGTLQRGFVVVGNAPTADGTSGTATPGSLLVINNQGKLIQTITDPAIQYPWDMALVDDEDFAIAFVSNALTGTVIRLDFKVSSSGLTLLSTKTIASGYLHRGDPVTLFVAPTGLAYDARRDVLYIARPETMPSSPSGMRPSAIRMPAEGRSSTRTTSTSTVHLGWQPRRMATCWSPTTTASIPIRTSQAKSSSSQRREDL